jgi:Tol biopolymer transport system component
MVGRLLGQYRIGEKLGAGAMGDVYRAEDTRLGRDVAIKVLPDALANDPDRLQRLAREARVLAFLNHPNIAAIYALEEIENLHALVLELVPGQNLAEKLTGGALPIEDAIAICRQVAAGLEAAHDRAVIHRDVKPANIVVSSAGQAKILDFGLAKSAPALGTDSQAPTLIAHSTPGTIAGTVSYMSPEQARGHACDQQTDIWAFGCVLYETLTGHRLFAAPTAADTLLQIIDKDADLKDLPAGTPPRIRQLIQRCVRRDPKQRLRHIGDARLELDDVSPDARSDSAADRRRSGWMIALAGSLLAAVAGWFLHARLSPRPQPRSVALQRMTDLVGLEETPALSPDGKSVAFVAESNGKRQIWVRLLAGGTPLAITKDDVDHYGPRWASDSTSLIYHTPATEPGQQGTIWEIPALGGQPIRLVNALGPGDLSHDGRSIAFIRFQAGGTQELAVAARDGSGARTLVKLPPVLHSNLRWSPDDRRIGFLREPGGAYFTASLLAVDIAGGDPRQIISPTNLLQGFTWTADGSSVIASSSQGSAITYPPSFNLWTFPVAGAPPNQLTFGESSYEFPDAGKDGRLMVSRVLTRSDIWKFPVTGDPKENVRGGIRITRQTGQVRTVSVSPSETEVALLSDNGGHVNVWVAGIADGGMRSVTRESDPRVLIAVPLWSPRGDLITFLSTRNSPSGAMKLWMVKPDGSDARDLHIVGGGACWSRDGSWLYYQDAEKGISRIRKMPVDGGPPVTLREDNAVGCAVAPDDSALYYARTLVDASGAFDFEVRAARPENGPSVVLGHVSGSRIPVSPLNFQTYVSPDGKWLATPLNDGSTNNLWALPSSGGEWRQLTDFRPKNVVIPRRIAWSKDGKYIYASVSQIDSDIVMISTRSE